MAPQIDLAMTAALQQHDADASILKKRYVSVYFADAPIHVLDETLAGDDTETAIQTQYFPCLFSADSAIVHEFLHVITFLETGAYDANHSAAFWHSEPTIRLELQGRYCP